MIVSLAVLGLEVSILSPSVLGLEGAVLGLGFALEGPVFVSDVRIVTIFILRLCGSGLIKFQSLDLALRLQLLSWPLP